MLMYMSRIKQFMRVQRQGLELFKKKNADYGDAFANYGPVGIIVRMGDKISRASNIDKTGITIVDDESLKDTLIDLHNYSAMALMLMEEENPTPPFPSSSQTPCENVSAAPKKDEELITKVYSKYRYAGHPSISSHDAW